MKDQINRLARGDFQYETPTLTISEANIQTSIHVGTTYIHDFKIVGSCEIKGIVYSSDYRVTVNNSSFIGVENVINYTVDTIGIQANQTIEGQFHIISNAKEISIPYSFKIIEKDMETSMGKVNNLFHFANLAQMANEEAQKIFLSQEFPQVFLKHDLNLLNIYHSLNKGGHVRNNIEEFLIAIHKKSPVTLSLSSTNKVYSNFIENFKDTVVIKKNTWGYTEFKVESDTDFIILTDKKPIIDADDFIGNKYELEYLLDRSKMHHGKNFGRIMLSNTYQTLKYEIEVDNFNISITDNEEDKEYHTHNEKISIYQLSRIYIQFRSRQIDLKTWIEKSNQILDKARENTNEDCYFKLIQAQVYITQQKTASAKWILENIHEDILQKKERNIIIYCYYLYINSLFQKDSEYSNDILNIIKKYYDQGHDYWQLLWIMFYINDDYEKNQSIKLTRIKEQFHKGCKSPVLYLEAANIFNAQPMLLRVLNQFELQVINFACKNHIINEKLAQQICELSKNEKNPSRTFLRILRKVYDIYQTDSMLNVLCTNLIRNEITGAEVFNIYEKSILKNFRITKLYEFYMESIDECSMSRLPKMVLLYFAYDNRLDLDKKAYLYANIIHNKEKDGSTYLSYKKQIELFAIDQLRRGRISENLIIIYKDIWDKSIIQKDTTDTIARVLFTYKITCENNNIKNVVVKHKEMDSEVILPLVKQVAYIQIYSENCVILFEDSSGNRKMDSISYKVERLYENPSYAQLLFDFDNYDLGLLLYFCELNSKYHKRTVNSLKVQNILLNAVDVTYEFKKELRNSVIHYLYNDYIGDEFEQYYSNMNTSNLSDDEAAMLVEACIMQGLYEDAYDLVLIYGFTKVKPKRLFKLCRRMIQIINYEYNEMIISMCQYVFLGKKYDDIILEYLVTHFNGTSKGMYEIYVACNNFNFDSYDLQERLIGQFIFSNSYESKMDLVFESYYQHGGKERIIEAYVALNSYRYFVKEEVIRERIFQITENRLLNGDEVTLIAKVALLKFYSTQKNLEEKQLRITNELLQELCLADILYEFYKHFESGVQIPYNAVDKTVVEFRANPEHKVEIHYLIRSKNINNYHEDMPQYQKEIMKDTLDGVFCKYFTLLYGETIEYYFTVIGNGQEMSTDIHKFVYHTIHTQNTNGRFDFINDMLASKELHDMPTLHKLMHSYCVQDYVTKQLFQPF